MFVLVQCTCPGGTKSIYIFILLLLVTHAVCVRGTWYVVVLVSLIIAEGRTPPVHIYFRLLGDSMQAGRHLTTYSKVRRERQRQKERNPEIQRRGEIARQLA